MAFLILIPQVITSAERVYLRVNSLGEDGYYVDKIDRPYLASFPSCSPSNEVASYTYCRLELYATVIACSCSYVGYSSNLSSTSDTLHSIVKPHIATSQAIQTLNFIAEDGSSISCRQPIYTLRCKTLTFLTTIPLSDACPTGGWFITASAAPAPAGNPDGQWRSAPGLAPGCFCISD